MASSYNVRLLYNGCVACACACACREAYVSEFFHQRHFPVPIKPKFCWIISFFCTLGFCNRTSAVRGILLALAGCPVEDSLVRSSGEITPSCRVLFSSPFPGCKSGVASAAATARPMGWESDWKQMPRLRCASVSLPAAFLCFFEARARADWKRQVGSDGPDFPKPGTRFARGSIAAATSRFSNKAGLHQPHLEVGQGFKCDQHQMFTRPWCFCKPNSARGQVRGWKVGTGRA